MSETASAGVGWGGGALFDGVVGGSKLPDGVFGLGGRKPFPRAARGLVAVRQ